MDAAAPTLRSIPARSNALSVARRARSRAALSAHALASLKADLLALSRLKPLHVTPRAPLSSSSSGAAAPTDGLAPAVPSAPDPVGDYVTSPTSLFGPLRLAVALGLPLLYPLSFIPPSVLLAFATALSLWYLLIACYFSTEIAMRPPWYSAGPTLPMTNLPPYWSGAVHDPLVDLSVPFSCVSFVNGITGHTLRGWYVESPTSPHSTRAVVFVHGAGRDRRNFMRHAPHFLDDGVHVLLFDTSEHGLSEITSDRGRGTSFGAREQHDVAAAVTHLRQAHACTEIAIVGTSTGASSAILAAAGPLANAPPTCVVAENPFTRADDLLIHHLSCALENYLAFHSLTRRRVRAAVFWLASRVLLFRMGQYMRPYGPVDVVADLSCPLLVAHSTADDVVPFNHGRQIFERAAVSKSRHPGGAVFLEMHDAAHCALYDKSPSEWVAAVLPFVLQNFEKADNGRSVRFGPPTESEVLAAETVSSIAASRAHTTAAASSRSLCQSLENVLTSSESSTSSDLSPQPL